MNNTPLGANKLIKLTATPQLIITLEVKNIVKYIPKTYSKCIQVVKGEPAYGKVQRGGKVFFRNYRRPIKNGLSQAEVFSKRVKESQEQFYSDVLNNLDFVAGNL
jgi:hypothetical protein